MQPLIAGLLAGLSLIIAIGAQNAFVLRQGLAKQHVLVIVTLCSLSDALLILLGVLGLGAAIQSAPVVLDVIRWLGVAYLIWFGISSLRKGYKSEKLQVAGSGEMKLRKTVLTTLSLTFLNPHVYLDTVIFLGGLSHQFGTQTAMFTVGAISASFIWFFSLGFGAAKLSPLMAKPIFWKILDASIALIMFGLALTLAFMRFS